MTPYHDPEPIRDILKRLLPKLEPKSKVDPKKAVQDYMKTQKPKHTGPK